MKRLLLAFLITAGLIASFRFIEPFFYPDSNLIKKEYPAVISAEHYTFPYVEKSVGQDVNAFSFGDGFRHYDAYVPDNLEAGRNHPVIFLFHGAGRTGASMIERWYDLAREKKFIIIAPHAIDGSWKRSNIATLVQSVVGDALEKYPIDKDNMFLFGHSAGGVVVNYAALMFPYAFKAAAIHGGYANKGTLKPQDGDKMPVLYIIGTKENVFSPRGAEKVAIKMSNMGHHTELLLITGHTHWYYNLSPQINRMAWYFFEKF